MKTILIFVTTLDGKITKWGDPHVQKWTSQEDRDYFNKTWRASKLTVMGRGTYDLDPVKAAPGGLLVIMSSKPEKYGNAVGPGDLEFTDETPKELVARFTEAGYEEMLVVGGAHVATSFLKENLIDELWLTLEPKIYGSGGNFVVDSKLDIELQLLSCETVNDRGTMIAKYRVIRQ